MNYSFMHSPTHRERDHGHLVISSPFFTAHVQIRQQAKHANASWYLLGMSPSMVIEVESVLSMPWSVLQKSEFLQNAVRRLVLVPTNV